MDEGFGGVGELVPEGKGGGVMGGAGKEQLVSAEVDAAERVWAWRRRGGQQSRRLTGQRDVIVADASEHAAEV